MRNKDLFIPVILGTARKDRHSEAAAKYVYKIVSEVGVKTKLVDVRDMLIKATIPAWIDNDKAQPWRKLIKKCDGLIIVAPEYNHSFPGELKLLLDRAYKEYARKPVAICGAGGGMGGDRMVEHLRTVMIELSMVPIRSAVYFANVSDLFDSQGKIQKEDIYHEQTQTLLAELLWYAKALKKARA